MKLLAVDEYIKFNCIGGKCPISCCGGNWGIPIDDESYDYYMSVDGEFGKVLRNGITKLNGFNAFKLDERTKDCTFLDEDKLCRIYKKLGPNSLCETCRTYPRAFYDVGDIEFCYLANSCPEVNRMIIQRKEPFDTLYDDSETLDRGTTGEVSDKSIRALITGLELLQNRTINNIRDRILLLLLFVEKYQECVKNSFDTEGLIALFADHEMYIKLLDHEFVKQECDIASKIHVFLIIFRSLMKDSYEHSMWERCVDLANNIACERIEDIELIIDSFFNNSHDDIENELEQLIVYRFFVVFMQGFENVDYFDRVVYEVLMLCGLETYMVLTEVYQHHKCSQEDRILFYSLCERIEHTKKQKSILIKELHDGGFYNLNNVIRLISWHRMI